MLDKVDFFPESLNAWREKGYAEKVRWGFFGGFQGFSSNPVMVMGSDGFGGLM
jgi:hypothetical protein